MLTLGVRRLVLPAASLGPPHDVVVGRLAIAEGGLLYRVLTDEGQGPNDGVHGAAFDGSAVQLCGGERYRLLGYGETVQKGEHSIRAEIRFMTIVFPFVGAGNSPSLLWRRLCCSWSSCSAFLQHFLFLRLGEMREQERHL